jgi:hypothetical protein
MKLTRWMGFAGALVFALGTVGVRTAYGVDVCSLLTPAEAASALGVPETKAGAGLNRCIWTPKEYKAGAGTLTVTFEGANDGAKMMKMGTAVPGVGDEAIQTVLASTKSTVLHVRKGSTWFVVSLSQVPLDQATQVEKTVAQEIIAKM